MTSKVQLDRDVISGIFKYNLAQQDVSNFKLGLVSKKCLLALKTACDVECKGARLRMNSIKYQSQSFGFLRNGAYAIWSSVMVMIRDIFKYCVKLRVLACLKRIFLAKFSDYNSNPDHRSEILRIISESSGTLKELCHVPYIFLPHLPHTLKLEKLTTSGSIPMNYNIKDFLQLSAKEVQIDAQNCYLPSHLLKNINAQTLHMNASGSWAEVIEESSVEIQANPSIQEISIVLRNHPIKFWGFADKIYDIKKIIESIQKGYPNLTLLKIQDIYKGSYLRRSKDFLQFFTKLFIKTEALLSELQDLPFSIQMKQVFEGDLIQTNYIDYVNEISLRKDEWKDFEEVKDDPRANNFQKYLSLKKSTQFGEEKSLEVTFYQACDNVYF